jgi:outer membrane protein OmpA-like peptidoglycan-associated protein
VFNEYPDTNIQIFGHTDSSGSDEYNQKLSEQRAAAVQAYLSSKGLKSSRFTVLGKGESEPIETNDTAAGRAKNRRVEFAITANEKNGTRRTERSKTIIAYIHLTTIMAARIRQPLLI